MKSTYGRVLLYFIQSLLLCLALMAVFVFSPARESSHDFALAVCAFPVLLFAGFYGFAGAFASLLAVPAVLLWLGPFVFGFFSGARILAPAIDNRQSAAVYAALCVFSLALAAVYQKNGDLISGLKKRLKILSLENYRQKHTIDSMTQIYTELEERVSKNHDNMGLLYNLFENSGATLDEVFAHIIKAVELFAHARKCVIRKVNNDLHTLECVHHHGYDNDPPPVHIPEPGTIEGWVCRNNEMFSIRMVSGNLLLERLYHGGVILAFPVHAENRVWGVLSIEKMEFYKYNLHTEQVMNIAIRMAEPAISRCLQYREALAVGQPDTVSGLPPVTRLDSLLGKLIEDNRSRHTLFSLAVVEIVNISALINDPSDHFKRGTVLRRLAETIQHIAGNRVSLFQYRDNLQIAMVMIDLDNDATALLCLELLGSLNQQPWDFGGNARDIEVSLGYAGFGSDIHSVNLLENKVAEMLEKQRRMTGEPL